MLTGGVSPVVTASNSQLSTTTATLLLVPKLAEQAGIAVDLMRMLDLHCF